MKNEDIIDALEGVSEEYVDEVAALRQRAAASRRSAARWIAAAACLVLAAGAAFAVKSALGRGRDPYQASATPVPAITDHAETVAPKPTEFISEPPRSIYAGSYADLSDMFGTALTLTDAEYAEMLMDGSDGHSLIMNGIDSREEMLDVMELLKNVPLPRSDMFELMWFNYYIFGNWENSDRYADFIMKSRENNGDYCRITIWIDGELSSYDGWLAWYAREGVTPDHPSVYEFPEFTRILRAPDTEDAPESSTRIRSSFVGERGAYAVDIRLSSTNTEWAHPVEEYVRSFTFGTFADLIPGA